MTLLAYLIKLIVVSAILFGYYRLFLRNKRFHHYNRFFLLSALLLSIVLPFIRIPILYQPENPVHEAMYRTVSIINADYGEEAAEKPLPESFFTVENLLFLAYVLGALFLVTLLFRSLLYIHSLRKRYSAENITGLRFYNTKEPGTPFSFFRSIFWNQQLEFNSSEGQQIFRHELFHVKHRHSADRLLAEVLTALFWFNPFFHLIKKELKAIHEFLADQFAISGSDRYAYATLLVQQALDPGKHAVTNHFFQNHIKRRIAMITQFQQSKYGYWSRLMVLPVALILFCFVTLYAKTPTAVNVNETVVNTNAIIGENIIYDESPKQNQPAATDTLPDKAKIEMEQMKLHQQRMKELQETKSQRYQETMNAQRADREILQKQMRERQLLLQERQQNKKDFNEKALRLKLEMQAMQQQIENDMKAQNEKMERLIKESELKAKEDPAYREEHQKRMEQMKLELLAWQDQTRKKQEAAQNTIRQQMLELKYRAEKEQQAQRDDLRILEQRMKELQDTVPAKKAKEAKPAKSQQPAKGSKTKVEKVKEVEVPAGKVRKVQEVKVEKQEEVEEVRDVRVEKINKPVRERRIIKENGTTRVLLRPNPDSVGSTRRVIIAGNRKVVPGKTLKQSDQPKEVPQKRPLKIKLKPKEGSAPVSDQDSKERNFSGMALLRSK